MVVPADTNIDSIASDLLSKSLKEFCSGLGMMFDLKIGYEANQTSHTTLEALKSSFGSLSAVYSVEARGSINGVLYLILDQKGVFTLPGIIVMHPPKRIQENCEKGTMEDANPISDAIGELGNLLVGEFDKASRDVFDEKTHLLQIGTKVGFLKDIPEVFTDISDGEEFSYAGCEVTVGSYVPFQCGVIMPLSLFSAASEQ